MTLSKQLTEKHKSQINQWVREACEDNNLHYAVPFIDWYFDAKLTRCAGKAYYHSHIGFIKLSPRMWERCDDNERRNTVKHEICHLLVRALYGSVIDPHGIEWKECMKQAKEEPTVYHTIHCQDLRKEYIGHCKCGTWTMTKQQMKKGLRYCSKCESPIRFNGETTRD